MIRFPDSPDRQRCLLDELGLPLDYFYRCVLQPWEPLMKTETQKTANPLETQKGGDHYKAQKIQPVEFAMTNGWDFCAASALKYLSRHRRKDGKLDIEKAGHFIELREALVRPHNLPRAPGKRHIPMHRYIAENKIEGMETVALNALYAWVNYPEDTGSLVELKQAILALQESYNGS